MCIRDSAYIRRTSDRLCKEHGLSVVMPGQDRGKSYACLLYTSPRNKLIAMTLQHLKYVQRSGQGVDIMFQSMLTEGKPYPEYASTPNSRCV